MRAPLFPLWEIDQQEYDAICAYLGLTPHVRLYDQLSAYLAGAPFRFPRPGRFSRFLARRRLTRWRIARLDLATRLFIPDHPLRHKLNCVIAVHECDGQGYREMSASPAGWKAILSIGVGLTGFALNLAITIPWLGWQILVYVTRMPFRGSQGLAGRRTLISGVNRGLGRDLMLHCLEQGAEVIGIVRNPVSRDELLADLPANAPVTLLVADLSRPGDPRGRPHGRADPPGHDRHGHPLRGRQARWAVGAVVAEPARHVRGQPLFDRGIRGLAVWNGKPGKRGPSRLRTEGEGTQAQGVGPEPSAPRAMATMTADRRPRPRSC